MLTSKESLVPLWCKKLNQLTNRKINTYNELHNRRPQTVGGFKTCFWGTGSNTWHEKALRTPNHTLFGQKCKMRPPATKGNKKKDKLGDKIGDKKEDKLGDKLGDKGDKTSGRRTHHPTQAQMWGDHGRQGETRPSEGGHTIQHRHTCGETMGDKGRQDLGKADKPSNKGKQEGRQGETRGDKGRQDPREGGHTIQH